MIAVDPAMLAPPVAAPMPYLIVSYILDPREERPAPLKVNKLSEVSFVSEYQPGGKVYKIYLPY